MAAILIVDDELFLRELLRDVLLPLGHTVEMAADGMEGLSKIRDRCFQLVLLDIRMPGISGLELLRLIRRIPERQKLPVLMCTAEGMTNQVNEAFEAGAAGYILKPFDFAKIIETVNKTLAANPCP